MSINEEIDHQLNCVDEDLTKLSIDNQHNNENITSSSAAVVAHSQQQQDEIYSEMDSGFQSRADSVQEKAKKKILKEAININKANLQSPKAKRIHDSIAKVFGNDDPPAGFGLIYPKYYYLEQKKPQPMQPLKVWRGFNGNIYFEPIQCQPFNKQEKQLITKPVSSKETSRFINNNFYKEPRSKTVINIVVDTHNSKPNTATTITTTVQQQQNQNQQELLNENNNIFITENQIDTHKHLPSSASIHQPQSTITTTDYYRQSSRPLTMNSKKKLVPNVQANSANGKNKIPLRGLAYKHAKKKIIDQTANIINYYSNTGIDENYLAQLKQLQELAHQQQQKQQERQNNLNETMVKFDKKKVDYKEMMKKIHRGVTSSSKQSKQSNNKQLQTHQVPVQQLLPKTNRTTSAYIAYSRVQQSNNNSLAPYRAPLPSASANAIPISSNTNNNTNETANNSHNINNSHWHITLNEIINESQQEDNFDSNLFLTSLNNTHNKDYTQQQQQSRIFLKSEKRAYRSYTQKDSNATKLPLILSPANLK